MVISAHTYAAHMRVMCICAVWCIIKHMWAMNSNCKRKICLFFLKEKKIKLFFYIIDHKYNNFKSVKCFILQQIEWIEIKNMLKNVLNSDLFIKQQPHITNLNLFRSRYPSLMCADILCAMMMIIIIISIIINVIRWHRVVVIASNICSLNFSWISLCSDCGNQKKIFCEILTHVADHREAHK